jgi:hypothetical protein
LPAAGLVDMDRIIALKSGNMLISGETKLILLDERKEDNVCNRLGGDYTTGDVLAGVGDFCTILAALPDNQESAADLQPNLGSSSANRDYWR